LYILTKSKIISNNLLMIRIIYNYIDKKVLKIIKDDLERNNIMQMLTVHGKEEQTKTLIK